MQKIFSPKTNYWLKTLSKFASIQIVVQALGFASGILLIRNLDKQEYAYFVLANSMQGTMSVLADSGISSALSSIGGKVWQEPYRFGQLIKTAIQLKIYLAIIAVVIVTPILMWMLLKNGASWIYASILIIGILIELHFYLSDGVMIVVPRLHSQFNRLQNLGLIASFTRITLLLGSSIFALNAAVGIFASTIASGLKNRLLWHWIKKIIRIDAPANREDKQEIVKLIKFQAHTIIFYCFQGQLTIWLISIFGNTDNIAEVGALGRLSALFSVLNLVIVNVVLPSFARSKTAKSFLDKYAKTLSLIFCICSIFLLIIYFYPQSFLFLLGSKYDYLVDEVFLISLLNTVQFTASILWSINASKGWMEQAWLFIPTIITTQIILLMILDISTVKGIIIFSICSIIPASCINFYMTYFGLKRWQLS